MQLRETSERTRAASLWRSDDAASSHVGLLDIGRTLLRHLQYCDDCSEREHLVLNACIVRLDAAVAVGAYPYLVDGCADDLAAQINRIQAGGFPCSTRRLRRVG